MPKWLLYVLSDSRTCEVSGRMAQLAFCTAFDFGHCMCVSCVFYAHAGCVSCSPDKRPGCGAVPCFLLRERVQTFAGAFVCVRACPCVCELFGLSSPRVISRDQASLMSTEPSRGRRASHCTSHADSSAVSRCTYWLHTALCWTS